LQRIAALFQIEAEINGHRAKQRHVIRQERMSPRFTDLKDFLTAALANLSRKSTLAVAIRYSLSRWPALTRFAADGRLEMTNDAAEGAIRGPQARRLAEPAVQVEAADGRGRPGSGPGRRQGPRHHQDALTPGTDPGARNGCSVARPSMSRS
jgi:hypothetical protein